MVSSSIGKDKRFSFSKAWVQLPVRSPKILYNRQWLRCYCFRKLGTPSIIEDT